jgi:hypothetical protein
MMDSTAIIMILGAALLLAPGAGWMGIALIAVGAVAYSLNRKGPTAPAGFQPYPQPQAYALAKGGQGFNWDLKDPGEVDPREDTLGTHKSPHLDGDMLNIPLPVADELERFINLKYSHKTNAKRARLEQDMGSPFGL